MLNSSIILIYRNLIRHPHLSLSYSSSPFVAILFVIPIYRYLIRHPHLSLSYSSSPFVAILFVIPIYRYLIRHPHLSLSYSSSPFVAILFVIPIYRYLSCFVFQQNRMNLKSVLFQICLTALIISKIRSLYFFRHIPIYNLFISSEHRITDSEFQLLCLLNSYAQFTFICMYYFHANFSNAKVFFCKPPICKIIMRPSIHTSIF